MELVVDSEVIEYLEEALENDDGLERNLERWVGFKLVVHLGGVQHLENQELSKINPVEELSEVTKSLLPNPHDLENDEEELDEEAHGIAQVQDDDVGGSHGDEEWQ